MDNSNMMPLPISNISTTTFQILLTFNSSNFMLYIPLDWYWHSGNHSIDYFFCSNPFKLRLRLQYKPMRKYIGS